MNKPSVLVVEDDKDIAKLLRYTLETAGFKTHLAYNGESGFGAACQFLPDVILLDLMLPGLDGWDIYGLLRVDYRTSHLPIVILTARAQEEERVKGLEMGADDFILKPFSPRELVARLTAVLRRRRSLRLPA
jgi:two-component system, OmpR family, phosphate regulon response regulator PhoB